MVDFAKTMKRIKIRRRWGNGYDCTAILVNGEKARFRCVDLGALLARVQTLAVQAEDAEACVKQEWAHTREARIAQGIDPSLFTTIVMREDGE